MEPNHNQEQVLNIKIEPSKPKEKMYFTVGAIFLVLIVGGIYYKYDNKKTMDTNQTSNTQKVDQNMVNNQIADNTEVSINSTQKIPDNLNLFTEIKDGKKRTACCRHQWAQCRC